MTIRTHIHVLLLIFAAITLVACGGSGTSDGDEPRAAQGQFIDSIVTGLRYETPTTSGFTDEQGRFNYRTGETVRFFVGDVFIGEAVGQAIITPVELVAGAVDENDTQVLNIAIFLQSVDDDGDESNGIRITTAANDAAAGQAVDFTLSAGVFDTDGAIQILISSITASNGAARTMVSRTQARDAFRRNLLGLLAGEYRGTFAGDDRGSWVATVDAGGVITGTSTSDIYEEEDNISGTLSSSGEARMSGTVGTSVFSGNFSRSGEASGTWANADGDSGSFAGRRVSLPVPPPGTLSISGNDSNAIGVSVTPNLDPAIIDYGTGDIVVTLAQQIFSSTTFESRSMSFSFNENDGSIKTVGYMRLTSTGPTSFFYSYSLDCDESPQICATIVLDAAQRQVTFNSTTLAADIDSDSSSTGSIEFTGTLDW